MPTTTDVIPTGTTTKTQWMLRAYLPDGRIADSRPRDGAAANPTDPGRVVAEFFGRLAFPAGTRFEHLERTVTTTATAWSPTETRFEHLERTAATTATAWSTADPSRT